MLTNIINHIFEFLKFYIIPERIFTFFQPAYHRTLGFMAAVLYRFPSRKIKVIAVTGTKGKSTTVEIISALLEEAGYKTALSNTIRYKIGGGSHDNHFKMSMPGRFFVQRLIRHAVRAKCDFVVLEMTSQGAIQHRHKYIHLDTLVVTNISPEHIEAHGSFENYVAAKVSIALEMKHSNKRPRTIIVNTDDASSPQFLAVPSEVKSTYGIRDAGAYFVKASSIDFMLGGKPVHSPLSGLFNLYNLLAGITAARVHGVSDEVAIRAIEKFSGVRGRVERIDVGQDFAVVVDYAHTVDSLEKLYQVFESSRNICVLGGAGGGRDKWRRKEMGRIAHSYCDEVILTNEDPYDENPREIVDDVAVGVTESSGGEMIPTIIMDRREAIAHALKQARTGDSVLITGKGTDPYIMGPKGTKTPWDDARVAKEELQKLGKTSR